MTYSYVHFPQQIAGFLKSEKLAWNDTWPALSAAKNNGTSGEVQFNTIEFAYDPNTEKFGVAVSFGDKDEVWLTEDEFKQEVPNWVNGGPEC